MAALDELAARGGGGAGATPEPRPTRFNLAENTGIQLNRLGRRRTRAGGAPAPAIPGRGGGETNPPDDGADGAAGPLAGAGARLCRASAHIMHWLGLQPAWAQWPHGRITTATPLAVLHSWHTRLEGWALLSIPGSLPRRDASEEGAGACLCKGA
jgi:hypothetical protein